MGIKFHCPNGHKLNVKSFLADKRGICPHCGVRFTIPTESGGVADLAGKSEKPASPQQAEEGTNDATTGGSPVEPVSAPQTAVPTRPQAAIPVELSDHAAPVMPSFPQGTPAQQPDGPTPFAAVRSVVPNTAASAAMVDPLRELPNANWYVRPRSGGQFGPAVGEVMRKWIHEGRVAADSLVWREGWADWKDAAATFPEFGATAASPEAVATSQASDVRPSNMGGSVSSRVRSRRRSNQMTFVIILLMAFLALFLFAGLIYVISRQNFGPDDTEASLPSSATVGVARLEAVRK